MAMTKTVPDTALNLTQQLFNIAMVGDTMIADWFANGGSISQAELTAVGLGHMTPAQFADIVQMYVDLRDWLAAGRGDVLRKLTHQPIVIP